MSLQAHSKRKQLQSVEKADSSIKKCISLKVWELCHRTMSIPRATLRVVDTNIQATCLFVCRRQAAVAAVQEIKD